MKVVAAALLAVMTSGMMAGPAVGQTAGPRVVVNGVDVPLVAPAVVLNGQVLAPMPGLFDPMGAVSAFYETTQTIVVTNRLRTTVQMRLNDTIALVNGKTKSDRTCLSLSKLSSPCSEHGRSLTKRRGLSL